VIGKPGSVLVVCTGNVCRSPYIERRLRFELRGTGIEVTSAGTEALVGHDMDAGTRARLEGNGIDASGFVARQLTPDLLSNADLVVAAAREHRAAAARLHPASMARTVTLRDLADLLSELPAGGVGSTENGVSWVRQVGAAASRRRGSVPARQHGVDLIDPIGGPPSLFAQMAAEADEALLPVVRVLRQGPTLRTD
jgi:protein-tyrosine phosphatase